MIIIKKKSKKRLVVLIISAACLILVVIGIAALRFTNSKFRYNFDVTFNCDDTHYSYVLKENGADIVKASLSLPSSTTFAFRHSDVAVTYYSKLSYEEFVEYYVEEGYTVVDDAVYTEDGVFIIKDANSQDNVDWKYNFIDIELVEMQ